MVIDRYLIRQTLMPFGITVLVLWSLFIVFTLGRFLTEAAAGSLLLDEVFRITGLRWLIAQEVLLPIAFYLSVVLVWGRLYEDLEIDALAAGGIGTFRLMVPMVLLAVLVAGAVAALALVARPWAWQQVYQIEARAEASAEVDRIRAGQFNAYPEYTLYIQNIGDNDVLEGIFLRKRASGTFEMLSAPRGQFLAYARDNTHRLTLFDARTFQEFAGGEDVYGRFGTLDLYLRATEPRSVADKIKIKSPTQLLASDTPEADAEFQWRLSAPLAPVLLLFAGVPLARTGPRRGRFGRLILALGVYAVYFNLMGVARTWVEQEKIATFAWVHGLLIAFAAIAWWRGHLVR